MKIPVIEKIMKLPQQTEESLNDAFSILLGVEDRKGVDYYLRWVRSEAKKIRSAAMYELIRKTYFYAAQYSFDDFMIAMEWNREPKARFWLPRRKVLEGKHHIATKIQNFMDDPEALFLGFSMPPGCGKTTIIKFLLAYIIGRDLKSANMYISYSDGDPDNIVFVNDVAWGGGDSLSMPIAYVYGADVFVHDWVFDKRDKSFTKPRVIAKILQHKIKMGQTEANNGGEEYSDDVYRILRQDYSYSINMSHKKAPTNMGKLT